MNGLPPNLMGLTVSLTMKAGEVTKIFSTMATVQTHKVTEMKAVLEGMWELTLRYATADEQRICQEEPESEEEAEESGGG